MREGGPHATGGCWLENGVRTIEKNYYFIYFFFLRGRGWGGFRLLSTIPRNPPPTNSQVLRRAPLQSPTKAVDCAPERCGDGRSFPSTFYSLFFRIFFTKLKIRIITAPSQNKRRSQRGKKESVVNFVRILSIERGKMNSAGAASPGSRASVDSRSTTEKRTAHPFASPRTTPDGSPAPPPPSPRALFFFPSLPYFRAFLARGEIAFRILLLRWLPAASYRPCARALPVFLLPPASPLLAPVVFSTRCGSALLYRDWALETAHQRRSTGSQPPLRPVT